MITKMILNVRRNEDSEKNSESQMGFVPTTLHDLIRDLVTEGRGFQSCLGLAFFRAFISSYV